MNRHLLALALAGVLATSASAVLNFNLTVNSGTVAPGGSYSLVGTITGVTTDLTLAGTTFSSTAPITIAIDPAFQTYLNSVVTGVAANYSGNIGTVTAPTGTAAGLYDGNTSFVTVGSGPNTPSDNEFYEVQVVPEPTAFASLGIGLVTLARRRRRR